MVLGITENQLPLQGVDVVGRNLGAAFQQRAKPSPVLRQAAHRDPAEVHAVVPPVQRHEPGLGSLADPAPVAAGHLQGGLDRLGAGVCEKDVVQIARSAVGHRLGQLSGPRMAVPEEAVIFKGTELVGHRVGDLGSAMPQDHTGHSAGRGVKQSGPLFGHHIIAVPATTTGGLLPPAEVNGIHRAPVVLPTLPVPIALRSWPARLTARSENPATPAWTPVPRPDSRDPTEPE